MSDAPPSNYTPRSNRQAITQEPDTNATWTPLYPEMLGAKNQGHVKLAEDFTWNSNPKQYQEELTETQLRRELAGLPAPALPSALQEKVK